MVRPAEIAGPPKPTEAEVVHWLKRALVKHGLAGRPVREIVVDADGSYLRSPYRRYLEPTGTIRIGDWRPDLVCVLDGGGAERLAGFEVKSTADHEKGLIQATRYREGVHEAYLCIPALEPRAPDWIRRGAAHNQVGLVRASPTALLLDLEAPRPLPDPRTLAATRRYILGEAGMRAFGLNKPLHYAAVLTAFAFSERPWESLRNVWELQDSAIRLAARGAENLGLIAGGAVTVKGKAYADVLRLMGFTLGECRRLTKTRLLHSASNLAATLRAILLQHPAVEFIVQVLLRDPAESVDALRLASRALAADEDLARAIFGEPPSSGEVWRIRPTTRFQLKAALYDTGILDTPLARGASGPQQAGGYDPRADRWQLGAVCQVPSHAPGR
jgi:hypothetical protein